MFFGLLIAYFIALLQFYSFLESIFIIAIPLLFIFISVVLLAAFRIINEDDVSILSNVSTIILILYIIIQFNTQNHYLLDIPKYIVKETDKNYIIQIENKFFKIKKKQNQKPMLEVYEFLNIKNYKIIYLKKEK